MELDKLQDKTLKEFLIIKASKMVDQGDFQEALKHTGCLAAPFLALFFNYSKKNIKKEKLKRSHDVYEIEADDLLKNSELKKEICSSLILLTKGEIVTEENFINYVTAILYENKIRTKFVIPLEPVLFAHIAYKISENGINNFCLENG